MLYLFNKTIVNSKSILYSLIILYGVNKYQSEQICKDVGINPKSGINELKDHQVNRLISYINKNLVVEENLKLTRKNNLENLLNIKHIRGIRLSQGLPVHGQRTHTNAKTAKKSKIKTLQKQFKFNKNKKKVSKKIKKKK